MCWSQKPTLWLVHAHVSGSCYLRPQARAYRIYFTSWTPKVMFHRWPHKLWKISHLVVIRWNLTWYYMKSTKFVLYYVWIALQLFMMGKKTNKQKQQCYIVGICYIVMWVSWNYFILVPSATCLCIEMKSRFWDREFRS